MRFRKMLIANRGEIAIRIARAAAEAGLPTVAIYSNDDATSLHVRQADEARALPGSGARAYLDIAEVIAAAQATGCDALHPGYGFLSENPELARQCEQAGIAFVGPGIAALQTFGDKVQARALAQRCGVPVIVGSDTAVSLDQAHAFLAALGGGGAIMIKAVAGGGGRGMRAVHSPAEEATCALEPPLVDRVLDALLAPGTWTGPMPAAVPKRTLPSDATRSMSSV